MNYRLALVLPCFNEEEALPSSMQRLDALFKELIFEKKISPQSRILFVNDGSRDRTWELISQYHRENPYVCGLDLAGNVGHQNALMAGMETAKDFCDVLITIDADLQDDLTKIPEMLAQYESGCDIVYGIKNERRGDSWLKRKTALLFYRMMKRLGVETIYNHADFRLLSRRAVEQLCRYREKNLYLRGIIPLLGFKSGRIYEDIEPRQAGESKYTLRKMVNLAVNGITSFSVKPVRFIFGCGFFFWILALLETVYATFAHFAGKTVSGWASIIISIWFIGGCILIALGIIGEYIGKIYIETKDRPRHTVQDILLK